MGTTATPIAGLESALGHWKLPLTDLIDTPRSRAPRRNEGGAAMNSDCPTVVKLCPWVKPYALGLDNPQPLSTRHAETASDR